MAGAVGGDVQNYLLELSWEWMGMGEWDDY